MNNLLVMLFLLSCALLAFQMHANRQTRGQNRRLEKIMRTLEETLDLVEAQTTKVDSLIALTNDLHQRVLAALGSDLTPSQQMRVDAVFDEVTSEAGKVDAALTANTVQATAGAVSGGPSAADIKATAGTSPAPDGSAPTSAPPIGSSA